MWLLVSAFNVSQPASARRSHPKNKCPCLTSHTSLLCWSVCTANNWRSCVHTVETKPRGRTPVMLAVEQHHTVPSLCLLLQRDEATRLPSRQHNVSHTRVGGYMCRSCPVSVQQQNQQPTCNAHTRTQPVTLLGLPPAVAVLCGGGQALLQHLGGRPCWSGRIACREHNQPGSRIGAQLTIHHP